MPVTRALTISLRGWVALAEEVLVTVAPDDRTDDADLVAFLLRTLDGAVAAARDSAL
ncbi:hypothetical protein [Microbacterium sp. CH12i]|uniref:hypothetical protein n=1 Tax=Microbacterium sp. CH12i TaxID=1479651 RepID=UPI000AD56DA0|nr:hypothetical protein [Microbacterium sp. CH12i]